MAGTFKCTLQTLGRVSHEHLFRPTCSLSFYFTVPQRNLSTSSPRPRRRKPSIAHNFVLDGDEAEWLVEEKVEERYAEEVATLSDEQRMAVLVEGKRQKEQKQQFIKDKIIERKYFRPLPGANILNCRAKAQIQYLYHHSPNEDGVEAILEIFPLNEQALRSLLKQKRKIFKNEAEKIKHDSAVYRKWVQLAESSELSPSLQLTIDNLIANGRIDKLQNAAGVDGIPEMPSPTLQDLAHQFPSSPGKMTSLLVKHGSWKLRSAQTTKSVDAATEEPWKMLPEDLMQDSGWENGSEQQPLFERIIKRFTDK